MSHNTYPTGPTAVLVGIKTEIEWQCACQMMQHLEPGKRITIEFETPQGALKLFVERTGKRKALVQKL